MNYFKYSPNKHFHNVNFHEVTNIIPASDPVISHRKDATTTLARPNIFGHMNCFYILYL